MDYFGWNPYVRVAARRQQAPHRLAKLRKKGNQVSPVQLRAGRSRRRSGERAWCENLERYSDFETRLPRGRTYVRNGSVIDLQVAPGTVTALVSGSDVYDVRVDVAVVPKARLRAAQASSAANRAAVSERMKKHWRESPDEAENEWDRSRSI